MKKIAVLTVTLLFLIHGAIGLERSIFANEILTSVGAFVLAIVLINRKLKANKYATIILIMVAYGSLSFLIGHYSNTDATLYEKLRTTPIVYSSFCFFTGYYIVHTGVTRRYYEKLIPILMLPTLVLGAIIGGKLSPPSIAALTINRTTDNRRIFYFFTISFIVVIEAAHQLLLGNSDGSSTIAIMLVFCVMMFKLKDKVFHATRRINIVAVLVILLLIAAGLKITAYVHNDFFTQGFSYFGDSYDANSIWRLMFWAKIINDMSAVNWLLGIGLANPLFNELDPTTFFIIASEPDAIDRPYTLGLHNSILTYLVRLGSIGLFLFLYITIKTLKSLTLHNDMKSEALFVSFSLILIPAFFNVVLESPLYAGQFWLILGICARHQKQAKEAP